MTANWNWKRSNKMNLHSQFNWKRLEAVKTASNPLPKPAARALEAVPYILYTDRFQSRLASRDSHAR